MHEKTPTPHFFPIFQSNKSTVEHIWTIDNFRMCFVENNDTQRSSVFSIGGISCRMLLVRQDGYVDAIFQQRFNFRLQPVNKTPATTKAFEQRRCEWKLTVQNGNNKGIVLNFDDFLFEFIAFKFYAIGIGNMQMQILTGLHLFKN
jgi:hypothetical protein